jgi:hypothetical protein
VKFNLMKIKFGGVRVCEWHGKGSFGEGDAGVRNYYAGKTKENYDRRTQLSICIAWDRIIWKVGC